MFFNLYLVMENFSSIINQLIIYFSPIFIINLSTNLFINLIIRETLTIILNSLKRFIHFIHQFIIHYLIV